MLDFKGTYITWMW